MMKNKPLVVSTMTCSVLLSLLLTWIVIPTIHAEKDDSYYRRGVTNPNTRKEMYWKEPYNVLQDLDQFDKLYIQIHSCAYV